MLRSARDDRGTATRYSLSWVRSVGARSFHRPHHRGASVAVLPIHGQLIDQPIQIALPDDDIASAPPPLARSHVDLFGEMIAALGLPLVATQAPLVEVASAAVEEFAPELSVHANEELVLDGRQLTPEVEDLNGQHVTARALRRQPSANDVPIITDKLTDALAIGQSEQQRVSASKFALGDAPDQDAGRAASLLIEGVEVEIADDPGNSLSLDSSSDGAPHQALESTRSTRTHAAPIFEMLTNLEVESAREIQQLDLARQLADQALRHAEIVQQHGHHRFTMRLDPPELGQLLVEMKRTTRGVSLHVVASDSTTARILQRGANAAVESLADSDSIFQNARIELVAEHESDAKQQASQQRQQSAERSSRSVLQPALHSRETHEISFMA